MADPQDALKLSRDKVYTALEIYELLKQSEWYRERQAEIDEWDREGEALIAELLMTYIKATGLRR